MDSLTSCYFCGAALDDSVSEYPVVPPDLRPGADSQQTVTLCRTCHGKLARILETVLEARAEAAARGEQTSLDTSISVDPDPSAVTDEAEDGDDEGSPTPDDAAASAADDDATSAGDDGGFEFRGDQEADAEGTDAAPADEDGAAHDTAAGADDPAGNRADDRDADRSDDAVTEGDAGEGDDAVTEGDADSEADAGGDVDGSDYAGDDADDDADDEPSLTALEYSKVMRLLQNRDFPVPVDDIREVAVNAYQLSPEEFDAVVEAAKRRDLLAEEDGQFVRPE